MTDVPHLVLLVASHRGLRFLREVRALAPDARLTVFSFREQPWEPPFLDAIRETALAYNAAFYEARHVGQAEYQATWDAAPTLLLSVGWRYLVPRHVYEAPRQGSYVFHDSLLPRYRGFSPTVWAIINGETETGVTLFKMTESVDAGPIVDQVAVPINRQDTIAEVRERVTGAYIELIRKNLGALLTGQVSLRPQDEAAATYTCKLLPDDVGIDWRQPAETVYNLIRAYTRPYPGAWTLLHGQRLRVWRAEWAGQEPVFSGRVPGRIVQVTPDRGVLVLAGQGAVRLLEVQREGESPRAAHEVLTRVSDTLGR